MTDTAVITNENREHRRNRLILDEARNQGFIGTTKDTRVSGRVSTSLLEAAKRRANVKSDSDLLELALSKLAIEDDFGPSLLRLKGSVAADVELAI